LPGVGVHREVRAADPMVRRARPAGFQPGGGGGTSLDLDTAHHLSRLPRSGRRMLPCRRLRPRRAAHCASWGGGVGSADSGWLRALEPGGYERGIAFAAGEWSGGLRGAFCLNAEALSTEFCTGREVESFGASARMFLYGWASPRRSSLTSPTQRKAGGAS